MARWVIMTGRLSEQDGPVGRFAFDFASTPARRLSLRFAVVIEDFPLSVFSRSTTISYEASFPLAMWPFACALAQRGPEIMVRFGKPRRNAASLPPAELTC